jgi:hypothetical protein
VIQLRWSLFSSLANNNITKVKQGPKHYQHTRVDAGFRSERGGGQLSDCNSLSGLNPSTNQILNKNNNNLIYILI